jgi:hypothetical protein
MLRFTADNQIRSRNPLTDDQIRRVAPSVFAETAHGSRSDRYTYIPTSYFLAQLRKEGFQPFEAMQARARDAGRREHTKHLLRLRHLGADAPRKIGDSVCEVVLVNSHDGSSAYEMSAGLLRLVCTNGLMVSEGTLGAVKVPHKGDANTRVVEGAYEVLDGFTRVVDSVDDMRATKLDDGEQIAFARAALNLRFDPAKPAPVTEEQILRPRRIEDRSGDLWTTLNRLQESLVRGGLRGRDAKGKPTTTRAVRGIDGNVSLNRALWTLAEEMKRLKTAA